MAFVLDASVTLAWLFEETASRDPDTAGAFRALGTDRALVPAVLALEVANGLRVGERLGRATGAEVAAFVDQLATLGVEQDDAQPTNAFVVLLERARRHALTVYDASYLELAIRERVPLATLDRALGTAARRAGIELLEA